MRFDRVPPLLVLRAVLTAALLVGIALQAAFYQFGPTPPFFALLLAGPLLLVVSVRVAIRRSLARPQADRDTASGLGSRVRHRVEGARSAIGRARRRRRVRHVERAASEAAKRDDPLAPEGVRTAADALFRLVHLAWRERDAGRLATLLEPQLLAEWEQREAKHSEAGEPHDVVGDVSVEYVDFTTGERGDDTRVVVRIEATLRAGGEHRRAPLTASGLRRVSQYWTLSVREGLFTVLEIEDCAAARTIFRADRSVAERRAP